MSSQLLQELSDGMGLILDRVSVASHLVEKKVRRMLKEASVPAKRLGSAGMRGSMNEFPARTVDHKVIRRSTLWESCDVSKCGKCFKGATLGKRLLLLLSD